MKATLNGTILAEAPKDDLLTIEGNYYFPPSSVTEGVFIESPTPYTCPWKGEAQYWNATIDDEMVKDVAWSYPRPYASAAERVGHDITDYVAFDRSVEITDN